MCFALILENKKEPSRRTPAWPQCYIQHSPKRCPGTWVRPNIYVRCCGFGPHAADAGQLWPTLGNWSMLAKNRPSFASRWSFDAELGQHMAQTDHCWTKLVMWWPTWAKLRQHIVKLGKKSPISWGCCWIALAGGAQAFIPRCPDHRGRRLPFNLKRNEPLRDTRQRWGTRGGSLFSGGRC